MFMEIFFAAEYLIGYKGFQQACRITPPEFSRNAIISRGLFLHFFSFHIVFSVFSFNSNASTYFHIETPSYNL